MTVTGRIDGTPADIWNEEVLTPQFAYEAEHLLHHYVAIEKVLLLEYLRMGLVDVPGAAVIAGRLDEVSSATVRAKPDENMSDISFALERHIAAGPIAPFPAWHVDRSRNDLQACAQLLAAREQVRAVAADLLALGRAAAELAESATDLPMPGYTHSQAAQIISPGFFFAALSAETLASAGRLLATYDQIGDCPLGAGSMAGQELAWDRERMAALLGLSRAQPHALVSVASRGWALAVTADLAGFAVTLSRFVTDLMAWGGSAHGFLYLPDELTGISAAMPQKRNYPVLERIRGRCGQVAAAAAALAAAQCNTSYTNTVEVSKEAGAHLRTQLDALRSTLRLTLAVVTEARFDRDRMRQACDGEHLGAFTLANRLTLTEGIAWRTAQVIVGRYVREALATGMVPGQDGVLLKAAAARSGQELGDPDALLVGVFDPDVGLRVKKSPGSAHPDAVRELLATQRAGFAVLSAGWAARETAVITAAKRVAALLAAGAAERS